MSRNRLTRRVDRPRAHGERGHLMVGLMVAVAILTIGSAVAVQEWKDVLRRDIEAEMIFRAEDLARALRRYRKDHSGQLPTDLKLLLEPGTRGQYFLRRLYKDPLVRDGKWGLLYASPQGGVIDPNAPGAGAVPDLGGVSKTPPTAPGRRVGGFGETSPSPTPGRLGGGFSTGTREIGGLPIAGVKSLCKEKPFRVRHEEAEYSMWLFTVFDADPLAPVPGQQGTPQTGPGPGPGPGPRPRRGEGQPRAN